MAILLKIFWKKVDFFLAIFNFFIAALDAQRNFMPTRYIFSFYLFLIKSYSVFCKKKLPKLNILSVIAID